MAGTESQDDTTRPTFEEAFAEDSTDVDVSDPSPEADSSQALNAEPSAAAPTPQPTPTANDERGREISGSIPADRHKAILERERSSHAAEMAKVGWAREAVDAGLTREGFYYLLTAAAKMRNDPSGFLGEYLQDALNHPQHGQAVRRWMANAIGQEGQPENGNGPDPEPQPDFQLPDGTPFYSAQQTAKREAWLSRRLKAELMEDVAPLREHIQSVKEAEAVRAYDAKQEQDARNEFYELEHEPHFKENKLAIRDVMVASGWKIPLWKAYQQVLREKVFPSLGASERAKVIAEMQTQAHAGRGARPGAAAPSSSARPKSFKAIPKEEWEGV